MTFTSSLISPERQTVNGQEVYDRQELYEQVWSQPVVQIAPSYGISDVALAKICRKLHIPLPGRGYGAKRAHGHSVRRAPLPQLSNVPVITRRRLMENRMPSTAEEKGPELIRIEQLKNLPPDFIPTRGADNQLIVKAGKILRTARTDDRHILRAPWREACLDIRVSKESLPRALRIMGNLIGLLEMERLTVTLDSAKSESTVVTAFGEQIQFGLIEKVRRFELPAAPPRSTQHARTLTFANKPIDFLPTGELSVQIWSYCSEPQRKVWRDGKRGQLESLLLQCVAGFMRIGLALRRHTEELRKEELEHQRRHDEFNELKQQIEAEEARVKQLEAAANNWKRAQLIREYVKAAETSATQRGAKTDSSSETRRWIEWATQQADRVDPIATTTPSILDKKAELARLQKMLNPWYA